MSIEYDEARKIIFEANTGCGQRLSHSVRHLKHIAPKLRSEWEKNEQR